MHNYLILNWIDNNFYFLYCYISIYLFYKYFQWVKYCTFCASLLAVHFFVHCKINRFKYQEMVILEKKKAYIKPPKEHEFERRPVELSSVIIKGYSPPTLAVRPTPPQFRPPLYAVGWGWNSGGRTGNITEENVTYPRQVQHSITKNYVSSAAGQHHSLILSKEG